MKKLGFVLGLAALTVGCEETEECRALDSLSERYEQAADVARRRAQAAERFEERAAEEQEKAKATLKRLGLETPEAGLRKVLDARVAELPGAKLARRVENFGPPQDAATNARTIWMINFEAKDAEAAMKTAVQLMGTEPLFLFNSLMKKGRWTLELVRATVDRIPIKPKPTPLPPLPDVSSVKSEFGFCGASGKRSKLTALKKEIDELREKAQGATVALPEAASWKGLNKRAQLLERVEDKTRELAMTLVAAAISTKADIRGVGYQEPRVVLEVLGGRSELDALRKALEAHRANLAVPPGGPDAGVVRVTLQNTALPSHQREPGHGPAAPHLPKKGKAAH